ncbi:delta-lactam-biosynthetic de-N-acetylase [Clostridium pasteurianum]|uniref:Delta-lactam-biosynthetic de-N-acetylase n=1 Tax=Clostridium pasteurianum BC1 TaxID=86416 RepID=R4KE05_CLOPA|nr:delta-lactam-biosynthetic de-N-acetylase [Clostridium pasteurianum]AGK97850.1 delta-lactam-biosynthetic de-N-acetylase [Clostridium pasteurianum BC1]
MKKLFIILSLVITLTTTLCNNAAAAILFKNDSINKTYLNTKTGDNSSTKENSWYIVPASDEKIPRVDIDVEWLKKYNGYYVGDTNNKYIYLTFDEGYENGYTGRILDILKSNNVKAAFFVTVPYIKSNKELVKRMADEGNLVCNHSNTHPSMATITNEEKFKWQLTSTEEAYKEATGHDMSKFFRPPMGRYSELSLNYTNKLGYKTIFWSLAYKDWLKDNQPNPEQAKKLILKRTHPGGIYLLHAVSKTNTDILDSLIKEWKSRGYEFKTLNDLQ